jgi:hypothetical protein
MNASMNNTSSGQDSDKKNECRRLYTSSGASVNNTSSGQDSDKKNEYKRK